MKCLFFPFYPVSPHLETDLELMLNAKQEGHEVFVILCKGDLKTCYFNFNHLKSRCILCQSKILQGLKKININKNHIIQLNHNKTDDRTINQDFENVDELINFKKDNLKFGLAAASTLIYRHEKDTNFNTLKYKKDILREINSDIYLYNELSSIIKHYAPDEFYFFNGRLSKPKIMIMACNHFGIKFYTHERAGIKEKYVKRENTYPHNTFLVKKEIEELWENANRENREIIARKWFEERRGGIEQSWYSFVKDQKMGLLPENFDINKKNVIIFNSTMEEYYTLPEYQNFPIYSDEIEGIKRILESLKNKSDIHIYLRMHPNLKDLDNIQTQSYNNLINKYPNFTLIRPESSVNSYNLMDASNIIICFGSTVGVEACYWNKPAILASSSRYEDLNVVYRPKTHQELIQIIELDIQAKSKENALKYGYWEKTYGIPYKYFKSNGLANGTFLGKVIQPAFLPHIYSLFHKFAEYVKRERNSFLN